MTKRFNFFKKLLFTTIIFFSIALSFADEVDSIYAIVNNDPITQKEFTQKLENTKAQYQAFGKSIPPKNQLYKQVLQKLIDHSLQLQIAEQNNVTASSIEVREAIANIAIRNKISYADLRNQIIATGLSFEAYQEEIKNEIIISKLQQQAIQPPEITEKQINEYLASKGKENKNIAYHVEDIRITLPDDADDNDITRAKAIAETLIKEAKDKKKIRSIIEKINDNKYPIVINDLGFLSLDEMPTDFVSIVPKIQKGKMSKPVETANGIHVLHLLNTKTVEPKSYVEQMHLYHILITPDSVGGTSEEAEKEARSIAKSIKNSKEFFEAAKLKSHDTKTGQKNGELGWLTSEELPGTLSLAVLKLKPKQISEPVESQAGWHILYIDDIRKVDISKDHERKQAMQILFQEEVSEQIEKWLSQLRHGAYIKILNDDLKDL